MKPIFLIGAALMTGAGIYGVSDFNKARQTQEFRAMYHQPEHQAGLYKPVKEIAEVKVLPGKNRFIENSNATDVSDHEKKNTVVKNNEKKTKREFRSLSAQKKKVSQFRPVSVKKIKREFSAVQL
ncbi:MAG: hypothetical protein N2747_01850 [Chitinophagaceae bacterium]|nr:hypothetical protein [Chitinophagaceae bacterium]